MTVESRLERGVIHKKHQGEWKTGTKCLQGSFFSSTDVHPVPTVGPEITRQCRTQRSFSLEHRKAGEHNVRGLAGGP